MHASAAIPASGAAPVAGLRAAASPGSLHVLPAGRLSCGGIVAFRQQARLSGRPVAELDVYASSADGGRFVACTRHLGATVGVRLPTRATITGAMSFDGRGSVTASENGRYASFAGPVGIGGARGLCFRATGSITTGGHTLTLASPMVCARAK